MSIELALAILLVITLTPLAIMDWMARKVDPATLMFAIVAVFVLSFQSWGAFGTHEPVVLSTPYGPLDTGVYRVVPQWVALAILALLPTFSFILRLSGRPLTHNVKIDVPLADYTMFFMIALSRYGWMILSIAIISSLVHALTTKKRVPYLSHLWLASIATMFLFL